jgi:nucleoside-diphosphate-sugar epimerase
MLGSQLVDVLLAAGIEVRAFVRPSSDVRLLTSLPVDVVRGDLGDLDAVRRAVAGVNWVFHAAGYLNVGSPFDSSGSSSQYKTVNVDLTESLLEASLEAQVERFIYVSSSSVYDSEADVPTGENAPLGPISDYGRSKLQAEEFVRTYQAEGLNGTIIRPCVTYGPGDRHFLPVALKLTRLPVLPLVNAGRNLFDIVYVRDVADLALLAAQFDVAIGKVYNAGPGVPTSLHDLIDAYRRVTGRGPRIVPVSAEAVRSSASPSRWLLARFAPGAEAMLTDTGLALMSKDIHLEMSQARIDLGYAPRFSLEQGIAATLAHSET